MWGCAWPLPLPKGEHNSRIVWRRSGLAAWVSAGAAGVLADGKNCFAALYLYAAFFFTKAGGLGYLVNIPRGPLTLFS